MLEKIKAYFINIYIRFEQYRVLKVLLEAEKEELLLVTTFDDSIHREENIESINKEIREYEDYIIAFRVMFLYHIFSIIVKTSVIYLLFVFISKIM